MNKEHLMQTGFLTIILAAIVFLNTTQAYSPIGNVNGWDRDRLAQAGISISSWKHEFQGDDPPLKWVQVTFDCAAIPKDKPVVMTAWFRSATGETLSATRVERATAVDGKITLVFCIVPKQAANSSLDIYIWTKSPEGGNDAHDYQMSLQRIAELANEKKVETPPKP